MGEKLFYDMSRHIYSTLVSGRANVLSIWVYIIDNGLELEYNIYILL